MADHSQLSHSMPGHFPMSRESPKADANNSKQRGRSPNPLGYSSADNKPDHNSSRSWHLARNVKKYVMGSGPGPETESEQQFSSMSFSVSGFMDSNPTKDAVRSRLYALRDECDKVRLQLDRNQARIEEHVASADSTQRTMENKELFLGEQALDAEVRTGFTTLMASIRTWSSKLDGVHSRTFDLNGFDQDTKRELDMVAPGCLSPQSHYWTDVSGKTTRLLFRGWIGLVLSQTVFRTRTGDVRDNNTAADWWLPEPIRSAASTVEDYLVTADRRKISSRAFNDWRALSLELMCRLGPLDNQTEEQGLSVVTSDRIMNVLKPFIPPARELEMRQTFIKVPLAQAIQLSRLIRRQRAAWMVDDAIQMCSRVGAAGFSPSLISFVPSYMDDMNDDEIPSPKRLVRLFVTPALIKRGNADGEDYDNRDCVVKATVMT